MYEENLFLGLAIVGMQLRPLAEPIPLFENFGEIINASQVDAVALQTTALLPLQPSCPTTLRIRDFLRIEESDWRVRF
jgi:hypothetical protein